MRTEGTTESLRNVQVYFACFSLHSWPRKEPTGRQFFNMQVSYEPI